MEKLFKGWIDHTAAGTARVRTRDTLGDIVTLDLFPVEARVFLDGKWRDNDWLAKMALEKRRSDYYLGKMGMHQTAEPLADLVEKYFDEKQNLAWKTIRHYRNSMKKFLEEFPTWENFNEDGLRAWKQKLIAKGLSNNSVYGALNDVSMLCNWLVENKKMTVNPFPKRNFKPGVTPPELRFWTNDEWHKFVPVIQSLNHHAFVGCRLAHDFGLRKVEIVGDGTERLQGVLWEDLNRRPGGGVDLFIRAAVTKGSKKSRRLLMDNAFLDLLGSRTAGPLVPLSMESFTNLFEKARKLSGIKPDLTFHGLRHTFAKDYLQSGGTLRELAVLMGHSTAVVTEIYGQFEQSHLDRKQEILSEKRAQDQAVAKIVEEQARSKSIKFNEL